MKPRDPDIQRSQLRTRQQQQRAQRILSHIEWTSRPLNLGSKPFQPRQSIPHVREESLGIVRVDAETTPRRPSREPGEGAAVVGLPRGVVFGLQAEMPDLGAEFRMVQQATHQAFGARLRVGADGSDKDEEGGGDLV